jgi:PAS domain S-box-containing protein
MDNPIRILNLEDDAYDATLIAIELKKEYFSVDLKLATTRKEFEDLLNSYSFDVVLVDNNLSDYTGTEALQYSKLHHPDLPVIFVSGTLGEEKAIKAMRYGASDFVNKDHLEKLGYALRRVLNETNAKNQLIELNKAISASEERLRYVVKASREMVRDMDLLTNKAIWNTGEDSQFGYLTNQIENSFDWWSQRLHPDDKKRVLKEFEAYINSNEEIWHGEYRFLNGEGGYTWVADNCCVLRDKTGKAYRAIGSMSNITKLHKAQEELLISKQKIEDSEKLKSSLLDNINHELRTPMNGILGFADLLLDHVDKPETRIMVENIVYSGHRLLNTVKSIMDMAQLSSAKYPINPHLVDLSLVVEQLMPLHYKMAADKRITLLKNIDHAIIANIDDGALQNILNHLINNAIKFTLKGWVEVSTTCVKSGNQSKPAIIIKDTGIGIPQDKQKMIFNDFRQASEGKDRSYQGSGLGLSIVQKLMVLMEGEITLISEQGVGSTFTLTFPSTTFAPKPKTSYDVPQNDKAKFKLKEISPDNLKVLLVEDDKINAELTSFYLEGVATVDIAYTGESAIEMAKLNNYSTILMDINLGIGIDGIEATKRIRQLNNYKHVPIIATTGYTLYDEIELINKSGFTEYLPKPFSRIELLTSIKKNFLISQV